MQLTVGAMSENLSLHFVVLHHTGIPKAHYDLMLETAPGSELATWRVKQWPLVGGSQLTELPNHRRKYLTFEGELSGGRGRVLAVTRGQCTIDARSGDDLLVRLETNQLTQEITLRRVNGDQWIASTQS